MIFFIEPPLPGKVKQLNKIKEANNIKAPDRHDKMIVFSTPVHLLQTICFQCKTAKTLFLVHLLLLKVTKFNEIKEAKKETRQLFVAGWNC